MASEQLIIGIDLGGTKTSTALVNGSGKIIAYDYQETPVAEGQKAVIARMVDAARRVMAQAGVNRAQVTAVGIGAPGPLEIETGMVIAPPNFPDWDRVPLRQLIEDGLGITAFIDNDANAAALGEHRFGAGRGTMDMIYVTVSTGIGGGLILNEKLYHGASGMAGEIGHITIVPYGPICGCGNRGCLEALASGPSIARRARERVDRGVPTLMADLAGGEPGHITAKLVAQAANQGDAEARQILTEAMNYLGIGMANLVNLFNPQLIVIGGGLTNIEETLFEPVRRAVSRHAFPIPARAVRIVRAELGDKAGVLGAAAVALAQIDDTSK
ncbi:MAG: ROK family protein [Chloroflexota bacterium]|nr:ROK family protein [Chloroflexota bacterium]